MVQEIPKIENDKHHLSKSQGLGGKVFLELGVKKTKRLAGGYLGAVCVCKAVMGEMKRAKGKCTENLFSLCAAEKCVKVAEVGVLD